MFVHGYRFVNPWHEPDCPPRGVHFCKTRQGGGDVGDNIASTEGKIVSLDGANVRHEEVKTATRTKLAVVVGPLTTATEMKTHAYVLHSLLGGGRSHWWRPLPPLVYWINWNQMEWVRLMAEQETTAWFAYDVLWIVSPYLNA